MPRQEWDEPVWPRVSRKALSAEGGFELRPKGSEPATENMRDREQSLKRPLVCLMLFKTSTICLLVVWQTNVEVGETETPKNLFFPLESSHKLKEVKGNKSVGLGVLSKAKSEVQGLAGVGVMRESRKII